MSKTFEMKRGAWVVMAVLGVVMGWAWWADWWAWSWWLWVGAAVVWAVLCVLLLAEKVWFWAVAVWGGAFVSCLVLLDSWLMTIGLVLLFSGFSVSAFVGGRNIGVVEGREEAGEEGREEARAKGRNEGQREGWKEGHEDGYVEGWEDGKKEGLKEAKKLPAEQAFFEARTGKCGACGGNGRCPKCHGSGEAR